MTARIFLLGDNIDTDQLAPGQYMKGGIGELAAHCLEAAIPDFAQRVNAGDVIVAGRNFGAGSSREQAAEALKYLGIRAVVAQSFAGIFYRNAINLGLPVLTLTQPDTFADGASVILDMNMAQLSIAGRAVAVDPLPENILAILHDGGLIAHLKKRLAPDA